MTWLSGWSKRVKVTVDQTDIDTALSDFPTLVYLSTSSGRNADDVSFVFDELQSDANRKKIAVTTSDGLTQCYVEIEKWDDANEQAWLWVKVPSIAADVDTDLYLYYDSTHADNTTYVGDPNSAPAENVWDSNFVLVSHMRDDPDTSHIRDSTGNNNDGVKKGAGEPVTTTSGKIDGAQSFDGVDDEITHTAIHSHLLTVEAWVNSSDATQTYRGLVDKAYTSETNPWHEYGLHLELKKPSFFATTGGVRDGVIDAEDLPASTWVYLAGRYDGSYIRLQVDTEAVTPVAKTGDINDYGRPTSVGWYEWRSACFAGIIDEVRISDIARSDSWIKASYESEIDHLLDFGSEELAALAVHLKMIPKRPWNRMSRLYKSLSLKGG